MKALFFNRIQVYIAKATLESAATATIIILIIVVCVDVLQGLATLAISKV